MTPRKPATNNNTNRATTRKRATNNNTKTTAKRVTARTNNNNKSGDAASFLISATELARMNLREPIHAVPNLVPEGITFLAGLSGTGKSMLALDMAIAVATGTSVLSDDYTCVQGEAIYMALERNTHYYTLQRLRQLLRGDDLPRGLYLTGDDVPKLNRGGIEWLDSTLTERPNVRLVVVDVFALLRGAMPKGSYETEYDNMQALAKLAEQHHVAMLLITHLAKTKRGDPVQQIMGSSALTAAANCNLVLERNRGSALGTLTVVANNLPSPILRVAFDEGRWTIVEDADLGPDQLERVSEKQDAVLQVMRAKGAPMKRAAIQDALPDVPQNTMAWLLRELLRARHIRRTGRHGEYELEPGDDETNVVVVGATMLGAHVLTYLYNPNRPGRLATMSRKQITEVAAAKLNPVRAAAAVTALCDGGYLDGSRKGWVKLTVKGAEYAAALHASD